jgi:hypothetical protein
LKKRDFIFEAKKISCKSFHYSRIFYLNIHTSAESPVVVHAFGDNGANFYQFVREELGHVGLDRALKAVVFDSGPSKVSFS